MTGRANIVAVKSEDVEGVERDLVVVLPAVQPVKIGDAINAYGLAIEDELLDSDAAGRLD